MTSLPPHMASIRAPLNNLMTSSTIGYACRRRSLLARSSRRAAGRGISCVNWPTRSGRRWGSDRGDHDRIALGRSPSRKPTGRTSLVVADLWVDGDAASYARHSGLNGAAACDTAWRPPRATTPWSETRSYPSISLAAAWSPIAIHRRDRGSGGVIPVGPEVAVGVERGLGRRVPEPRLDDLHVEPGGDE